MQPSRVTDRLMAAGLIEWQSERGRADLPQGTASATQREY
jgi:hypothetical protein